MHRYRRNMHQFTVSDTEKEYLGVSPTLPTNPGTSVRNFGGYASHGTPLATHYSAHYSVYGGLAPGAHGQRGHIHASPRLGMDMRVFQDDCSGGQWDQRKPSAAERQERAQRV